MFYSWAVIRKYYRLGESQTIKICLLKVLKVGRPKIKMPAYLVTSKNPLCGFAEGFLFVVFLHIGDSEGSGLSHFL